jgi:Ca2+-binding RTX toxin-like protein
MDRVALLEEEFVSAWRAQLAGELLVNAAQWPDGRIEQRPVVHLDYYKDTYTPSTAGHDYEQDWLSSSPWLVTVLDEITLTEVDIREYDGGIGGPGFQLNSSYSVQDVEVNEWTLERIVRDEDVLSPDYVWRSQVVTLPEGWSGISLGGWNEQWTPLDEPGKYLVTWIDSQQNQTGYVRTVDIEAMGHVDKLAPGTGPLTSGLELGRAANAGQALPSTLTLNIHRYDQSLLLQRRQGGDEDDTLHAGNLGAASVIRGGAGNDWVQHSDGLGRDTAYPMFGDWSWWDMADRLWGGFLDGGGGDDAVVGSGMRDVLIGGSGRDHLRGGRGADRFILVGDGVDLINPSRGGWWDHVAQDVLELPDGVTPGMISTARGQAIVAGTVHETLNLLWDERTHAVIMLPGADPGYGADTFDEVSIKFADGTVTDLRDLAAATPIADNVGYYAGNVRVALSRVPGTLSGEGADNVLVVKGTGATAVTTGAGRNLLQAFNPDSQVNLTLAAGSETWLRHHGDFTFGSTADVSVRGAVDARLYIQSSQHILENMLLRRDGQDLVLLDEHADPYNSSDSWSRELRFDGWFGEVAPHQVEFEASIYDESIRAPRIVHLSLQAWVEQFAARQGGQIFDGSGIDIGALDWQAAEVPITWGDYRLETLIGLDASEMAWRLPLTPATFVAGMGNVVVGDYSAVRFDPGIAVSDVRFSKSGDDLVVTLVAGTDSLRLMGWYLRTDEPEARFADGGMLSFEELSTLGVTLSGTANGDTLAAPDGYGYVLQGLEGNDVLLGNVGDDRLDGGAGADLLIGGQGDDTFVLSAADGTWATGYRAKNAGSPGHQGTGETARVDGLLASHDVMDGGTGDDAVIGTTGSDVLALDDGFTPTAQPGPRFAGIERFVAGGGNDVIDLTSQAYAYGDVTLDGGDGDDVLWASAGMDVLIGGAGNDRLDGGYGADTLIGGAGNDTYQVDNVGDVVTEQAGEGADSVKSSISWVLGEYLETLTLTGTAAIDGSGNVLNNTITGNGANNIMMGLAGNDTLKGGKGGDTYVFGRGDGVDTWIENDTTAGNIDIGSFAIDIAHDQLWFRRNGNNLEALVIGTGDRVVVKDWYKGNAYHLERFESGDGMVLLDSQVQALVDAMAAFAPPAAGQTTLPESCRTMLEPVLAVNWQ